MSRQYLGVAETAKLIRQVLKESFPGIKFGVQSKSYSGGASVNIRWMDGPNDAQVGEVIGIFEGKYFDGSIDYAGCKYAKLDGNEVRFGADYIHTNRSYSDKVSQLILDRVLAKYGYDNKGSKPTVEDYNKGNLYSRYPEGESFFGSYHWSLSSLVGRALGKFSQVLKVEQSATVARVEFAGDDGYGRGTVGNNGKPGEQAYLAQNAARERRQAAEAAALIPGQLRLAADLALMLVQPVGGVQ